MKKIIIIVLVLIFAFACIRITTSTYENIKRKNNAQVTFAPEFGILTDFCV